MTVLSSELGVLPRPALGTDGQQRPCHERAFPQLQAVSGSRSPAHGFSRRFAATQSEARTTKELIFGCFVRLSAATARGAGLSTHCYQDGSAPKNCSTFECKPHLPITGTGARARFAYRNRRDRVGAAKEERRRRTASNWWAVLGSNQWPLPCEGSALPLS